LQKALIKRAGFESQISELKEFAAKEKLEIVHLPTCLPACLTAERPVGRLVGSKGSLLRQSIGSGIAMTLLLTQSKH